MVIDAKAPEPALAVARAIGQRASVFIKETFGLGAAPKLAATLLTRTAATSPPGAPGVVDGKRYWNWHVDKVNRDAYDYSALVCVRRAGTLRTSRGDAATWIFRGYSSPRVHSHCGLRRRRGCDAEIPWGHVVATPRLRRGDSVATSRGDAAAATWIFRGDESRRRRGCDVEIPWR